MIFCSTMAVHFTHKINIVKNGLERTSYIKLLTEIGARAVYDKITLINGLERTSYIKLLTEIGARAVYDKITLINGLERNKLY